MIQLVNKKGTLTTVKLVGRFVDFRAIKHGTGIITIYDSRKLT